MCRVIRSKSVARLTDSARGSQMAKTNGTGKSSSASAARPNRLSKATTGISGLDDITGGGLPRGRPTLVCGGAGCGKTLLGAEFLVRGAMEFDEPGVLMAF